MLNYRSASYITVILAVAVFLLMTINTGYQWLLLVLFITYLALLVIGSVKICSGFYLDVYCRGNSEERTVHLTFDDGPDEKTTPQILEILEEHGVEATFFVIGKKAEKNGLLLNEILSKGHNIGNHSYSHAFWFDLWGRKKMEQDLLKTGDIILRETGKKAEYFRPPYGVTTPILAKVVRKMGYKAVGWSVRSLDTVIADKEKLIGRVVERLHPGAVILLHDDRQITSEILEELIVRIKKEGYHFRKI